MPSFLPQEDDGGMEVELPPRANTSGWLQEDVERYNEIYVGLCDAMRVVQEDPVDEDALEDLEVTQEVYDGRLIEGLLRSTTDPRIVPLAVEWRALEDATYELRDVQRELRDQHGYENVSPEIREAIHRMVDTMNAHYDRMMEIETCDAVKEVVRGLYSL